MNKKLETKCPRCKIKFEYYQSSSRPFCSSNCKEVDLGFWLTQSYSIAGKPAFELDKSLKLDEDFDLGDNFSESFGEYEEDK